MNLFIIGNGFDLMHGFKTSYNHFKEFLEKEYPHSEAEWFFPPDERTLMGGDIGYDDNECASFIAYKISQVEGEKWSDLEGSLTKLWLSEYFEELDISDEKPFHTGYKNEDTSADLIASISKILDFFDEWVSTIKINRSKIKATFQALIDKNDDMFLTFNYTATLQKLYGAKNVCHIHGKQNEKLYFGHGEDGERDEYDNDERFCPYGEKRFHGAGLWALFSSLRKKTEDALIENRTFFNTLNTAPVQRIYSVGFSFSDVDMIYLKEICRYLDTNKITWFLHDYNDKKTRDGFIEKIKRCGFNGKFATFSL
ncbi:MAG: bacteriophage abortive infection AbiH family protein [Firmicutes bacterium]|nr:bacteriophage abortive infection AbiH family protein [Bacillota bacterium]